MYSRLKQHPGERVEEPVPFQVKGDQPMWQQFLPRLAQHLGLRRDAQSLFPGYPLGVQHHLVTPKARNGFGFEDRPYTSSKWSLPRSPPPDSERLSLWVLAALAQPAPAHSTASSLRTNCSFHAVVLCMLTLDPLSWACRRSVQCHGQASAEAGRFQGPERAQLPAGQHAAPGGHGGVPRGCGKASQDQDPGGGGSLLQ